MNVLLGKVTAEPFANIIVPVPPCITPVVLEIVPLTESVPLLMFIKPVAKSIPPVFVNVNVLRFNVREFKFKVELIFKFAPKVTFAVPFNVNTFTALLVPGEV